MSQPKTASLDWIAPSELSRRWGVSVNTVYGMLIERTEATQGEPVPAGKLPALRIGGTLRVHINAVEAYERPAKPATQVVAEQRKAIRSGRRVSTVVANHLGEL